MNLPAGRKIRTASMSRRRRGNAAFEITAAVLIMLVVVAFAVDVCMALIAYEVNDRACRDAARSAAQGANIAEATQRAQRILIGYQGSGTLFNSLALERLSYSDFGGRPALGESPFVTVVTTANCRIPCPMNIFGNNLFGNSVQLRKVYTFPIVKLTVPL